MVTVDQNITVQPVSTDREQPAFVFGPNYELHRYTDDNEKAGTRVDDYEGESLHVEYPKVADPSKVDTSYTKLFGENVVVDIKDLTLKDGHAELPELGNEGSSAEVSFNGGYTRLLLGELTEKWLLYVTGSADPVLLYLTSDHSWWTNTGDKTTGTYVVQNLGSGAYRCILGDADHQGTATEVKDGASEISFSEDDEVVARAVAIPESRDMEPGDHVIVSYTASGESRKFLTEIKSVGYYENGINIDSDSSSEGGPGTMITIDDPVPVNGLDENSVKVMLVAVVASVEFTRKNLYKAETGSDNPGYQWIESGDGITVNELYAKVTAGYFTSSQWCKVRYADLYLTYRELITEYANDIYYVSKGASGVSELLGTVDPHNPLAQGVYMAALNAATGSGDETPPVYFMAVPSDDADGYDAVLKRASLTDKVYVLAPVTRDKDIIDKVMAHVDLLSSAKEKLWRISSVSENVPDSSVVVGSETNGGDDVYAIPVSADGGTAPDKGKKFEYLRIVMSKTDTDPDNGAGLSSLVGEGDYVRFGFKDSKWGKDDPQTYDTYKVVRAVSNSTVMVKPTGGGDSGVDVSGLVAGNATFAPSKIEILHVHSAKEKASLIASMSRNLMNRRVVNVFPPSFVTGGVTMGGEFAACAVAGLISSTEPQQPITNMPVRGIGSIPYTYETYSKEDLDEIAAGGTFIIAQDLPGDLVYVRHQITTATSKGNLNDSELSVIKNVDSISYAFADTFRPYYGRYNVTPELIAKFENICGHLISQLGGVDSEYGPQLIVEETTVRYVRQNETYKDHVDIGITLGVPYPCNFIDIVLTV